MIGNRFPGKTNDEKNKSELIDIYQTAESRQLTRSSLFNVIIYSQGTFIYEQNV